MLSFLIKFLGMLVCLQGWKCEALEQWSSDEICHCEVQHGGENVWLTALFCCDPMAYDGVTKLEIPGLASLPDLLSLSLESVTNLDIDIGNGRQAFGLFRPYLQLHILVCRLDCEYGYRWMPWHKVELMFSCTNRLAVGPTRGLDSPSLAALYHSNLMDYLGCLHHTESMAAEDPPLPRRFAAAKVCSFIMQKPACLQPHDLRCGWFHQIVPWY